MNATLKATIIFFVGISISLLGLEQGDQIRYLIEPTIFQEIGLILFSLIFKFCGVYFTFWSITVILHEE